jgi:hypothetical protein
MLGSVGGTYLVAAIGAIGGVLLLRPTHSLWKHIVFWICATGLIAIIAFGTYSKRPVDDEAVFDPDKSEHPRRACARMLSVFLSVFDRVLGDARDPNLPTAFSIRYWPWTARSFDRVLLFALIVPIGTVFAAWVVTGQVGRVEAMLKFGPERFWYRYWVVIFLLAQSFIFLLAAHQRGRNRALLILFGGPLLGPPAIFLANGLTFLTALPLLDTTNRRAIGVLSICLAFFFMTFLSIVGAVIKDQHAFVWFMVFDVIALALSVYLATAIASLADLADYYGRFGLFLVAFVPTAMAACILASPKLAEYQSWKLFGPLFLFVNILALGSAPLYWISANLTRTLIRGSVRNLHPWPFLAILVNYICAFGLVNLLIAAIIIALQSFNLFACLGQVKCPLLNLNGLLNDISDTTYNRSVTTTAWVYAVLLPVMLPVGITVSIGVVALLRSLSFLVRSYTKQAPAVRRRITALWLTSHWVLAIWFAIWLQTSLIPQDLDFAQWFEGFNVPCAIWRTFLGDPGCPSSPGNSASEFINKPDWLGRFVRTTLSTTRW